MTGHSGGGRRGERVGPSRLQAPCRCACTRGTGVRHPFFFVALVVLALLPGCHADKLVSPQPPGGGPPSAQPPATPAALGQVRSDGTTPIPQGSAITETSVLLRATVTDPDAGEAVRLQIELRPVGVSFGDTPTHSSAPQASGARPTVTVNGLSVGTEYHWQARAVDAGGRASAWVSFGGNAESELDFEVSAPPPPPPQANDPAAASPAQFRNDGSTPRAVGATTHDNAVVLEAVVTDPDAGASIRLQVEVRQLGSTFSNSPTDASTAVGSGGRVAIAVGGLADDVGYHWQYRAIDETGRTGPWTSFGGNSESAADFRIAVSDPPAAPGSLGQFAADGTTPIPVGGTSGGLTVVLKGTVSDPDPGDALTWEVEVRDTGTAFTNGATHTVPGLRSGDRASVAVSTLVLIGYHWQARTCDATRCSPWQPFGGNGESQPDYVGSLVSGAAPREP